MSLLGSFTLWPVGFFGFELPHGGPDTAQELGGKAVRAPGRDRVFSPRADPAAAHQPGQEESALAPGGKECFQLIQVTFQQPFLQPLLLPAPAHSEGNSNLRGIRPTSSKRRTPAATLGLGLSLWGILAAGFRAFHAFSC